MNRTAIVIALIAALLLAAWLWLWYNKDRYQLASGQVFDRNTGTVYRDGTRIDYPAAKTVHRKFDITEE